VIFFGWMGNSCVTTKLGPEQNQPKFSVRFYALCSAIRHFISTVVSHREKMCLFTTTLCRQLGVFLTRHHHHMSYTVYKIFKSHSWNYVMLNCATQKDNSIDAQNLNHAQREDVFVYNNFMPTAGCFFDPTPSPYELHCVQNFQIT